MTGDRPTLETAEERELWSSVFARATVAIGMKNGRKRADDAVWAYRERLPREDSADAIDEIARELDGEAGDWSHLTDELRRMAGRVRFIRGPSFASQGASDDTARWATEARDAGRETRRLAAAVKSVIRDMHSFPEVQGLRGVLQAAVNAVGIPPDTSAPTSDAPTHLPLGWKMRLGTVKWYAEEMVNGHGGRTTSQHSTMALAESEAWSIHRAEPSGTPTGPGWWWLLDFEGKSWQAHNGDGRPCKVYKSVNTDVLWAELSNMDRPIGDERLKWGGPCLRGGAPEGDKPGWTEAENRAHRDALRGIADARARLGTLIESVEELRDDLDDHVHGSCTGNVPTMANWRDALSEAVATAKGDA